MPKHYKEVVEDIINKMNEAKVKEVEEDAPVNSVAGGGVDLALTLPFLNRHIW